jgi:L-alanine-DL-glutamate epimerase-like enolase superfamily enzyme
MEHYYHFESNPMVPVKAHIALPTEPGFGIVLDQAKVEAQNPLTLE